MTNEERHDVADQPENICPTIDNAIDSIDIEADQAGITEQLLEDIPEPSSFALLGAIGFLALLKRKR